MESAVSMQAAILCGAHFILHSAGWLEGGLAMGYEKFVLDADFCGALHTYLAGIPLDDNQLALDSFREVGPGKHFFGCAHTLRNYETAFWDSGTADNTSFEQWRDAGEKDAMRRRQREMARHAADLRGPAPRPRHRRGAAGLHDREEAVASGYVALRRNDYHGGTEITE